MKVPSRMLESRYFSSLFVYLSTLMAVVVLAVTFILYLQFVKIEQRKIYAFSEESLSQISSAADSVLENAKMAIAQILLDKDMSKIFYPAATDPVDMKNITDRLNLIASMPFLHSVYLYNGKLDVYYISNYGLQKKSNVDDQEIVDIIKNFKPDMNLKPITRTIKRQSNFVGIEYNVYTFIYYEAAGSEEGSAIVLNVSDSWMKKVIEGMDKNRNGSIIMMDSQGVMFSSIYKDSMLSALSDQEFVQDILHSKEKSGHFIGKVDGVKSLITFASSDSLDWKFVRYTPYEVVVKDVNTMRTRTLGICLLLIIVGFALSYLSSKRLNRPMAAMLKKVGIQDQALRENSYKLKQDFLRQWMLSDGQVSKPIVIKQLEHFEISLDTHRPIVILLLKIDHFKEFSLQYSFKDRGLFRFGVMNIASEILSSHMSCEAVDLGDDHVVFMMNESRGVDLDNLIPDIQQAINKHLKMSVTAAVSRLGLDIWDCRQCYTDALEASQFRVFYGWGSLIHAELTAERNCRTFRYPIQQEEQLTDALMSGRMEDVKSLCSVILESTEGYAYKDLQLTVFRLFFAINMVVDTLEKASGYGFSINFGEVFAQLSELERLSDIQNQFLESFQRIEEKLGERKNTRYDELLRRIRGIIELQYMKDDLTIDSIADILNMSSVYLGRLIKKYTSKTINDYIIEVRIEKSMELLASSNKTITEISKDTGFASMSYFGRVFKKIQGITPNEYRQKMRDTSQTNGNES
ncbi:AraC family transcriptional regulator [Paenibacillus alba]|uniref:Helix-turn-helix domain-containing protein n=1 Tax=Paenibacillus alba TaxID=1197127 RepID=A0ABU6GC90_9BACL|nr:helix-turn-helix domain-containing protein [Paenibacillus alba]MEC0231813.1 helix-turn-helix domain-containing protein [Paenibacillus alba]